jgi:tetratricopeptide (TPR) repeat protein
MRRSLRCRFAIVILAGACPFATAKEEGRDLVTLTTAEKECRVAHEKEGTTETRQAWINSLAQLAWIHAEEKRDAEAIAPYRRAIEELPEEALRDDPEFVAMLHDGLGRALQNCEEFAEAERELTRGLEIRSEIPGGEVRLGLSEGHLGHLYLVRGRYAEAERLFHSALGHTPAEHHALLAHRHDSFGRYYLTIRAYQRSMEHFREAIRHASVDVESDDALLHDLRSALALCLLRNGDEAGALLEVAALLGLESKNPAALLRRADLLKENGKELGLFI